MTGKENPAPLTTATGCKDVAHWQELDFMDVTNTTELVEAEKQQGQEIRNYAVEVTHNNQLRNTALLNRRINECEGANRRFVRFAVEELTAANSPTFPMRININRSAVEFSWYELPGEGVLDRLNSMLGFYDVSAVTHVGRDGRARPGRRP